jgi:uncharacterized membrane protein
MTEPSEGLADSLISVTAVVVTGVVALAAVLDTGLAWELAVLGYVLVVPLVTLLEGSIVGALQSDEEPVDEERAALERPRDRYAAGEIDEAEFERRVERLLETVADAAAAHGDDSKAGEPEIARSGEAEEA